MIRSDGCDGKTNKLKENKENKESDDEGYTEYNTESYQTWLNQIKPHFSSAPSRTAKSWAFAGAKAVDFLLDSLERPR